MRQHVDYVAYLHLAFGVVGLGVAFLVGGIVGGAGLLSGDAQSAGILGVIAAFVTIFLGILAVPELVGGWALLRRKPWGRMLVLILSALHIFGFPIGTLSGAYSIWVLMNDEVRQMFNGGVRY